MKYSIAFTALLMMISLTISCSETEPAHQHEMQKAALNAQQQATEADTADNYEVQKTEEEWQEILSSSEYRILRNRGTELPFVNEYYDSEKEGVYYCGACGKPIFTSKTKFDSGTGWPSYWEPIKSSAIGTKKDEGLFTTRTEVVCSRCGSHLGHVFEDGPEPTGLRYCLNSAALDFVKMDLSDVDAKELPVREKMASNK